MLKPVVDKLLLLFFAAGTLVMIYVMAMSGKPLKSSATPHGIIDLEFANTKTKVEKVAHAWRYNTDSPNPYASAINNIYLDFIFLLFYAPFLYLCCVQLTRDTTKKECRKAGKIVGMSALLAGLFDVLENLGMLQSLSGNISGNIALFTSGVSIIKWILVCIALVFIIGTIIFNISKKYTNVYKKIP